MALIDEHKWLVQHPEELEKHEGKWVAVLNKKIIIGGNSFLEAFKKAKEKYPKENPVVLYSFKKGEEELIASI